MNRKFIIILCLLYSGFMAFLAFTFHEQGESFKVSVAAAGVGCGLVPLILGIFTKWKFNTPLVVSYLVFLVCSQYLGSIKGWYGLGWWDTLLHGLSGALLGFTGIALYERLVHRGAGTQISAWFVFLFVFSFAVFGGVVWEIYEFASDQLLGMTLQGGGNKDTMTDLIADSMGGLAVAIWAGLRTEFKNKR
ncbi:hypothetical protein A8F94_17260 [Bacillus sp. FJAT-27225]|uniref:hypothetical protein n=1 Tax=Bacillus sp. FJAT-27225 TaxID=1743144 RepID=UPI00080C262A|nr:hypothetical protein [Bacillus sp. FJAT-27225]OCA84447.1 hypothetical protein A8F94_17260 [Bacillus sp. FJAT-27225]